MSLDIYQIETIFEDWKSNLSERSKKYIHYYSTNNFLYHFKEINEREKSKALNLFENYVVEVENAGFHFDKNESLEIANKYMNRIADFYTDLGFKLNIKLSFVVFWGLLADILLLVLGVLSKIKFIPIVTLILFLYFI